MNSVEILERQLGRERAARKEAEAILEAKSLELFHLNQDLKRARDELERRVEQRTSELELTNRRLVGEIAERKKAEEQLSERTRLAELSANISMALNQEESLTAGLRRCAEAMVEHLGVAFFRVWTLNEREGVLELQASAGIYTHLDGSHGRIPLGRYKIGRIASTRQPHLTNDVFNDPEVSDREWARREGMVAFAGHPLIVEGRLMGVMGTFSRQPLSHESINSLGTAAEIIAQYIDRKRAGAELQASQVRSAAILEAALDCIVSIDHAGRVIEFNPAAEHTFGFSRDEILGKELFEWIIPERYRSQYLAGLRRYLADGTGPILNRLLELSALRADGTEFPVEVWITPLLFDGRPIFTASLRDITDRVRTEKEARAGQALLDTIRRVQSLYITDGDPGPIFERLLNDLLTLSGSEYGFIGEVHHGPGGVPFLKTQAISNISWDDATRDFYAHAAPEGMTFTNLDTLFGAALTTEKPVVSNDPPSDTRRGGIPKGHPPLRSFLGLPCHHGERLIGLVGIANRPGGYGAEIIQYLQPLISTCGSLIEAVRMDRSRREAEAALLDREERIRSIVEFAVDGIIVIDQQGIIEQFNPAAAKLFGYKTKEILGKNVSLLMPSPEREEHDGYIQRFLRTGETRIIGIGREALAQRKDGTTFPIELTVSEMSIRGEMKFTGIVRDVTQRKRTELELAEISTRLQAVLDSATQASIIATDPHGLITVFNAGAERMLGYSASEVVGKLTPEPFHLREEVLARSEELRRLARVDAKGFEVFVALARLGGHDEREWTYVRKDGSRLLVRLAVTAVREPDGTLVGFLGIAHDITVMRQREDDLKQAREEAVSASRSKSEFLANMSHEVRTPMTAVLGYTDILLEPQLGDEQRAQALHAIQRNGEHLLQIINDILDLSKIEAGKLELEFLPCSPVQVVREVISLLGVQAHDKGLQLCGHFVGPLPRTILSDETRVRQILMNLVGNAVKFTDAGEVSVRLRLADGDEPSMAWLDFEVTDHGIGLSAEQLTTLFQPFTQADSSTTRKYGGTGLGLRISKVMATALGGDILVRSQLGVGSTFTLRLRVPRPGTAELLYQDELSVAAVVEDGQPNSHNHQHVLGSVLLAEDNLDNQRILRHVLERAGIRVEIVGNGQLAVERALTGAFDAVLMDMQMPELDGYGATSLLRKKAYTGPIIAITAHAMRGDRERCMHVGCTDYLTKPVDVENLLKVLSRHLPEAEGQLTHDRVEGPSASEQSSSDPALAKSSDSAFMKLVRDYVRLLPGKLAELQAAATNSEPKVLLRLAHQLRGNAGMYGFSELSETAGLLEDAVREGQDSELWIALLEEMQRMIDMIVTDTSSR